VCIGNQVITNLFIHSKKIKKYQNRKLEQLNKENEQRNGKQNEQEAKNGNTRIANRKQEGTRNHTTLEE
jgi:hypothetical protein